MAYAPEMYGHKNYKALHAMAFSPYMVHNEWVYGKLPWDDDTEAYEVYLRYVKLHYRLIPYIYSQMWEQHTTGVGPIRPLALEFPDDPQTWSISNQYFYGNNLMVSFDHSKIYLPQGKWTYYWDGRVFEGGRTLTNFGAPPDQLPVFVRAGAILPMMPDMNYIGEKPVDPLILDIYPEGKSEFTLYEDDGITFDYEKGDYCQTRYQVAWDQDAITINIDARHAPGAYRPPARHYLLAIHNGAEPGRVAKDGIALAKKGSEADLNASAAGWSYANGITRVRLADIGKEMRISLGNST